jgi:hypothetical protein
VEEALQHPYIAAYHDPMAEPKCPKFDFSFDEKCATLSELKSKLRTFSISLINIGCILEELKMFRPPTPTLGIDAKISVLYQLSTQSFYQLVPRTIEEREQLSEPAPNLIFTSNPCIPAAVASRPIDPKESNSKSVLGVKKKSYLVPLRPTPAPEVKPPTSEPNHFSA